MTLARPVLFLWRRPHHKVQGRLCVKKAMPNLPAFVLPRSAGAAVTMFFVILCAAPAQAQPSQIQPFKMPGASGQPAKAPDLDLSVHHYTRILTAEGVLRESRYEEKMMRRAGHVWTQRVLPDKAPGHEGSHHHGSATERKISQKGEHGHRHFNHVLLPRHVFHTGRELRLEFVDVREREVISIAPSEYENVNFDGSWPNAFFLADPKIVLGMPTAHRASAVAGAQWRELIKGGVAQRVLWDEKRQIPLLIERVESSGRYLERVEIKVQPALAKSLPWDGLKGYAQKEYADFLD